jgi:hypothetical protein
MNWLGEKYPSIPKETEKNKVLLAFAIYNRDKKVIANSEKMLQRRNLIRVLENSR